MHHFSIKDIENLSGIKAHTIRIWEQRYGLCSSKRKESKHRYYDNEGLKQILRIAYLYQNGYKISKIAGLVPEQIVELASKKIGKNEFDVFINQLVEASVDYDQPQFEKTLGIALTMMGLEKWITQIVYPFMDKIGLLWLTDHVLPAQEHFSSHIVQKKIIVATDKLPAIKTSKKERFLLFTPEREEHEIPLLIANYLLKKQGIKTVLFGKNVSLATLQYYCEHHPVSHIYFHLITNFTDCETHAYLLKLAKQFPEKKIIAAGPLMKKISINLPRNVELIRSLQEMMDFAQKKN
jgi:MerR family transcriptional regulator, light-induced transcriptional regulator